MPTTTSTDPSSGDAAAELCYRPMVPVSAFPGVRFPTVTIHDRQYQPLCANGAKRAANSPGTIENHERGILGEYAWGKLFDIPNQVDTEIYEFGDPGYDFELCGMTIDVKTARPRWDRPSLMVDASKELTADFYALVHQLSQRCYRVLGYAPAAMVARAPIRQIGVHPADKVRVVDQDRLFPFISLLSEVFDLK